MNEAQAVAIFGLGLIFSWLGFFSGRAWFSDERITPVFIPFFLISTGIFIGWVINLVSLVAKNF